jgi:hypothetical protein
MMIENQSIKPKKKREEKGNEKKYFDKKYYDIDNPSD